MVNVAALLPNEVGVKVTVIVQLALAATLLPQLFVCTNSPALFPVIAKLVITNTKPPPLVKIVLCAALVVFIGWLLNVRLFADRLTLGGVVTVRLKVAETGERPVPLAVTVIV